MRCCLITLASAVLPLLVVAFPSPTIAQQTTTTQPSPFAPIGDFKGGVETCLMCRPPFSSDGKRFVAEGDGGLSVWDVESLKRLGNLIPAKGADYYRLSANGKTLFVACDREVRFYEVDTSELVSKTPAAQTWFVTADASPDLSRFVTVTHEDICVLKGWRVTPAQVVSTYQRSFADSVVSAEFDPTGRWIVVQTFAAPFHVLRADSGKDTCPPINIDPDFNPLSSAPFQAQFDPTGKARLLIPRNEGYTIIDPANGKILAEANWRARPSDRMRFSADGKLVVVTTHEALIDHGPALLIDSDTGKLLRRFGTAVDDCQISRGGRWALVTLDDSRVEIWDLTSGRSVQELRRTKPRDTLLPAFSPAEPLAVIESSDGNSTIWKAGVSSKRLK